jgi:hypothetical protein
LGITTESLRGFVHTVALYDGLLASKDGRSFYIPITHQENGINAYYWMELDHPLLPEKCRLKASDETFPQPRADLVSLSAAWLVQKLYLQKAWDLIVENYEAASEDDEDEVEPEILISNLEDLLFNYKITPWNILFANNRPLFGKLQAEDDLLMIGREVIFMDSSVLYLTESGPSLEKPEYIPLEAAIMAVMEATEPSSAGSMMYH